MADLSRSAAVLQQSVQGFLGQQRNRNVPQLPRRMLQLAEEEKVHIFNVGPWSHSRSLGSAGTFYIPGCPAGQRYAAMAPIPGIVAEPIPVDGPNMELRTEEGRYIAEQVLGIGMMLNPANALTRYGVFIAAGETPTEDELRATETSLRDYYLALISEIRTAHAKGPKEFEQTINERHRQAARALNLTDEPWLVNATPEARQICPMCGTPAAAAVVVCPTCKFVLDEETYEKHKSRFARK